jgi:hypothetical protein
MHTSILNSVRHQIASPELRLVVPPPFLPHRAHQQAAPSPSPSPRKPPILPVFESAKNWGFLTRSVLIFIERQLFAPVASLFAVQIPRFPCRPLHPCDIVNPSNAHFQETSPNSRPCAATRDCILTTPFSSAWTVQFAAVPRIRFFSHKNLGFIFRRPPKTAKHAESTEYSASQPIFSSFERPIRDSGSLGSALELKAGRIYS